MEARETTEWTDFHRAALQRPPRELLRRTLGCLELEGFPPDVAVDLGCGSGADSLEMLKRGWTVHAVDADAGGTAMLRDAVPEGLRDTLHCHVTTFEQFRFPRCGLIWAGYSLPFCPRSHWPQLWDRMCAALRTGGRLAGDVFGNHHAFAVEPDVMTMTERELRELVASKGMEIEAFDVEDGFRPSGEAITRWHAFGLSLKRPSTRP